ncbi:MAG: BofC C-terminal domain-containing protein [Lachnospiraceae bacterium]|nr:BofC C-terminal domain-containing protein [Lachnospiraceae bacterium]
MKKSVYLYVSTTLGMLTLVVVANYFSYHAAIGEFTKQQESYEQELAAKMEGEVSRQVESRMEDLSEEAPVANVEEKVSVDTVYQVENYDAVEDQTTIEYETLPEELVGFTREETDEYFKKYMQNLPVEEYLNGLQSAGVATFSNERLVIRKVYDDSKVEYRYYLISIDDEVVVYYGDQKTIYEYTGISTDNLSKEEQSALKQGIEVRDEDELFGLLENYSS